MDITMTVRCFYQRRIFYKLYT